MLPNHYYRSQGVSNSSCDKNESSKNERNQENTDQEISTPIRNFTFASATSAVNNELAERLARLDKSSDDDVAGGRPNLERLLSEQGKAACPELTKELLHLNSKLKTLTAEMHPTPPQDLESGYEIKDSAFQGETRFYRLPFEQGGVGFKVILQAIEGDPDLYVCQTHPKPSKSHHTWRSASEGNDVVHVQQGDPKFKSNNLYIGIHGHSRCHFRLKASWIENRNLIRDMDNLEFKKTATARVSEKILNFRDAQIRHRQVTQQVRKPSMVRKRSSNIGRASISGHVDFEKHYIPHSTKEAEMDKYSVKRKLLKDLAALRKNTKEASRVVNARKLWENDVCPSAEVQRAFWIGIGDFTVGRPESSNKSHNNEVAGVLHFGQRKLRERSIVRQSVHLTAQHAELAYEKTYNLASRVRRQEGRLEEAFLNATQLTELGGLALEVPVRSADERTRKAFARALVTAAQGELEEGSAHLMHRSRNSSRQRTPKHQRDHHYNLDKVGISQAEVQQDRQVVSRSFAAFRR